jgi:Spy/CpxP family protein refolding chaperone
MAVRKSTKHAGAGALALALAMVVAATTAAAQPGGRRDPGGEAGPPPFHGGPGMPGRPGPPPFGRALPPPEVMKELNLTDAQRAKVREAHEAQERRRIRVSADLQIAEMDLEDLLGADRPDPAAIDAAVERIGTLRHQMFRSAIETRLAVQAILTPDQRSKLRNRMRER